MTINSIPHFAPGDLIRLQKDGQVFSGERVKVRMVKASTTPPTYMVCLPGAPDRVEEIKAFRIAGRVSSAEDLPSISSRVASPGAGVPEIAGMSTLDRAQYIFRVIEERQWTVAQAADYFGYNNESAIYVQKWLTQIDPDLEASIRNGSLSVSKAQREHKQRKTAPAQPAEVGAPVELTPSPPEPVTEPTIPPSETDNTLTIYDEVLTTPPAPLPTASMQVKINDLESQVEWATTNLERVTALLEVAENEIRRLHQQLETAAPPTLQIIINGGTFHLYGGAS